MRRIRLPLAAIVVVALLAAPGVQARQPAPYRILVTNDDGVRAPGIAAVAEALESIGDVTIVAPAENQSGTSQSVVTRQPIFRIDLTLPDGLHAIGLTATPATAVQVAIKNIMTPRPDLVVAGINDAYNLGTAVYLGGTVGAARQAAMEGVPAIAASIATVAAPREFAAAARQVLVVARDVKAHGLPVRTFINVNVPPMTNGAYRGVRVTAQAVVRGGVETFTEEKRPGTGTPIYWSVYAEGGTAPEGTDMWAVEHGFVSITPLSVDATDTSLIETLRGWFK